MKKIMLILPLFMGIQLLAQDYGEIRGTVMDKEFNQPIVGANVWVTYGSEKIGASTDLDGKFIIKPVPSGTYNVVYSFTGMGERTQTGVRVKPDKINFLDPVYLEDSSTMLKGAEIFATREKLIDPEEPSRVTIDEARISKIVGAGRGGSALMDIAGEGSFKTSADGEIYFRGSRSGEFITFVDGVKLRGNAPKIPAGAYKSYTVYTGGLPAKYGDTMGGVVAIETKNYFDLYNQRKAQLGITY